MSQSLNTFVQSSEYSDYSDEYSQIKDKDFIFNNLCCLENYKECTNCQICDQILKEKSNCEFCGRSVCRYCLNKKRKDPESHQSWHKICSKCESKYLASIIQKQITAEKQNINNRIDNEQQLLENQRELLFNLKNNLEFQSTQQGEKSTRLKRQEADVDSQIAFLGSEVQELQIEKEIYIQHTQHIQNEQDELKNELIKRQLYFNDLQFELKRINEQIKQVDNLILEKQNSIENKLIDVDPKKKDFQNESFLPDGAASSGIEGIFRQSSQQKTSIIGLKSSIIKGQIPVSKEQQTGEKDDKDCSIF